MDPPHGVLAAPPAAAASAGGAGGGAADNPGCFWWQPVVSHGATRAQIRMAAAAAAFALFALSLKPATFPNLPAMCDTSAKEIMELRFHAGLLLLCAMAQVGAAAGALFDVPPSRAGRFLAFAAKLLGLLTLYRLMRVVIKVLFATGVLCLTGHLRTAELILHAILASAFVWVGPLIWSVGQPQGRD